jgi:hypothetical protein
MQPLTLTHCLLALAFCTPALAQQEEPIHLQPQPFVLEVREGHACDLGNLESDLFDSDYKGEKLCSVVSQTSIPGEARRPLFYTAASGPESFGILDLVFIPFHAPKRAHFYQSSPPVKSRRIAICVTASAPFQEGLGVLLRAAVDPAENQLAPLCASSGNYIMSFLASAKTPVNWTNLALGARPLDGSAGKVPYLIQVRVLLPAPKP